MWPGALVEELAARRCIIFLGAGASAGCISTDTPPVSPPNWLQLLEGLRDSSRDPSYCHIVDDLIAKEKFLDAAEVLLGGINSADFASYIRKVMAAPRFQPSSTHKSVLAIDPKIVVTTNYDSIYDNYCRSGQEQGLYNICKYYDSHLVSDLRSPVRQVIKAHGCISDPAKIVLTRSQYFKERQNHPNFYKVLDALFLTNTLFFVGYGLSDPDIQLLLENSNITYKNSHPHYALVSSGMNEAIKKAYKEAYNIDFIEFPAGNYSKADEMLKELQAQVTHRRESNPA
ncbi:SIR2-like protein [Paraperlucidibaca baekdonensis]|uniref:SIR2-like protein n=1 Tax=Paraperlucidibaca baekdonensis TaxID=748120 RepID=A0A3E0H9V6_9GAMM|nr:SIR2 family protein [Paraperlucidibaca baekdonensis]REH40320.1 SIR2-like protein [Paraperlucidibaca baekdonensis]